MMLNLSIFMAIFNHLEGSESDWGRAINSFTRDLRFWSGLRSLTPEDVTRLNLIRHNLSLRLATAEKRRYESSGRYFKDLVDVGNALMELGPESIQVKRDKLAAVLGVDRLEELADRTKFNQSIISLNTANQELSTMKRRVREVENVLKAKSLNSEVQGIYEELWISVADILEKDIDRAQADAGYFDLDVNYRRRILSILGR